MTTNLKPMYLFWFPSFNCQLSYNNLCLLNNIKAIFTQFAFKWHQRIVNSFLKPNSNVLQAEKANAAHYARQNPICCHILTYIKRKVPKTKSKRVVGHAISKIKSRHITSNVQRTRAVILFIISRAILYGESELPIRFEASSAGQFIFIA